MVFQNSRKSSESDLTLLFAKTGLCCAILIQNSISESFVFSGIRVLGLFLRRFLFFISGLTRLAASIRISELLSRISELLVAESFCGKFGPPGIGICSLFSPGDSSFGARFTKFVPGLDALGIWRNSVSEISRWPVIGPAGCF